MFTWRINSARRWKHAKLLQHAELVKHIQELLYTCIEDARQNGLRLELGKFAIQRPWLRIHRWLE